MAKISKIFMSSFFPICLMCITDKAVIQGSNIIKRSMTLWETMDAGTDSETRRRAGLSMECWTRMQHKENGLGKLC